jgi:hypothetical protein
MIFGIITFIAILIVLSLIAAQKDENRSRDMVLKLIYTFLIGIFLAVFVGVGIAAFYPEPKYPEPPAIVKYGVMDKTGNCELSAKAKNEINEYDKKEKSFQTELQNYNRNASIIALIASIIIVFASLTFFKAIMLIADGLLLGGVLTLLYSVMRGFGTEDNMFRFIVVSVGLFMSLFLGYVKFVRPGKNTH